MARACAGALRRGYCRRSGANWYTGNAHKWLFAPRGCGLLWTAPARQPCTFPAVLSHGTDEGYTKAFDWIGTRDVTSWLCFDMLQLERMKALAARALMQRNRAPCCRRCGPDRRRIEWLQRPYGARKCAERCVQFPSATAPKKAMTSQSEMRLALTAVNMGSCARFHEFRGPNLGAHFCANLQSA